MSSTVSDSDVDKLARDNTTQELKDKLDNCGLSISGSKKVMARRLLEHSALTEITSVDEELQDLRRRLGLHGDTIANFKDNGFRTMTDIRKLKSSPSFPSNMVFINLLRDRTLIIDDLMTSGHRNQSIPEKPQTAFPTSDPQDLRGYIQRRRNSVGDEFQRGESVMFLDSPATFDLTTKARDLPRPHDRVYGYGMSVDKNKPPALRITTDQFFAETLRVASNLAGKLQGRSAQTLQVYLRYAEFLAQQRCTYTDEAVLLFDEEFRTSATEEDFDMDNRDQLERISHKYFQSHAVRRATSRFVPYSSRARPSSSPKSDFPKGYCIHFNLARGCGRPTCRFDHKCGYCSSSNHPAYKCDKPKQQT